MLSAAPTVFSCVASRNKRGSGYRNPLSGILMSVSHEGSTLSSTVNGTNVLFLFSTSGALDPTHTYFRATGFQLRCLSE